MAFHNLLKADREYPVCKQIYNIESKTLQKNSKKRVKNENPLRAVNFTTKLSNMLA